MATENLEVGKKTAGFYMAMIQDGSFYCEKESALHICLRLWLYSLEYEHLTVSHSSTQLPRHPQCIIYLI